MAKTNIGSQVSPSDFSPSSSLCTPSSLSSVSSTQLSSAAFPASSASPLSSLPRSASVTLITAFDDSSSQLSVGPKEDCFSSSPPVSTAAISSRSAQDQPCESLLSTRSFTATTDHNMAATKPQQTTGTMFFRFPPLEELNCLAHPITTLVHSSPLKKDKKKQTLCDQVNAARLN